MKMKTKNLDFIFRIIKEENQNQLELLKKIKELEKEIQQLKNPKCPLCGSFNIIKHGIRKTLNKSLIQKYECKECKRKFSDYSQIEYRMRQPRAEILKAIKLDQEGYNPSQIAGKLKSKVSRQTVWKWLQNFKVKEMNEIKKTSKK